ncbi:hypothetical protein [Nocardioides sp. zg-DK7169]|uniref:hypothetical protein n=1 Tax=Nocardioides sp. zg-DK7169 TaxID=2736600 RepID=UPI0015562FF3|nr:hypothetical protein [Nocardioides sp. zg-DK7169]NPC97892.1 hypothetical protein [Nocardioides sp. zg-DK7169]
MSEFADLRSGKKADVGAWLAERLGPRYAYDSEALDPMRTHHAAKGVWKWRLSSGALHRIDTSVVVQAVRAELDFAYYAALDDTTFTARAVERLSSDRFIDVAVMPVLRKLLALPVAPRPVRRRKPKAMVTRRRAAAPAPYRRRRCAECALVSNSGGIGLHQKNTGHTGWVELDPTYSG